eukprot:1400488-Rhodomonas_salina.1
MTAVRRSKALTPSVAVTRRLESPGSTRQYSEDLLASRTRCHAREVLLPSSSSCCLCCCS